MQGNEQALNIHANSFHRYGNLLLPILEKQHRPYRQERRLDALCRMLWLRKSAKG